MIDLSFKQRRNEDWAKNAVFLKIFYKLAVPLSTLFASGIHLNYSGTFLAGK